MYYTIHLTLCMELDLLSKHLLLLSFHTDHHIHDGINLHHLLWLLLHPLLTQFFNNSDICSGIVQFRFEMLRNKFQTCLVKILCKKRLLFVSPVKLHKKHLRTICPHFVILSVLNKPSLSLAR